MNNSASKSEEISNQADDHYLNITTACANFESNNDKWTKVRIKIWGPIVPIERKMGRLKAWAQPKNICTGADTRKELLSVSHDRRIHVRKVIGAGGIMDDPDVIINTSVQCK